MVSSAQIANLGQQLRRALPAGLTVNVLPGRPYKLLAAAKLAGLVVRPLDATKWPFPNLMLRHGQGDGILSPTLVGQAEIAFHNAVRDDVARMMSISPGGAAIKEVRLAATFTQLRADADIIARGARGAGYAPQVLVEVKTGLFSDLNQNQSYIYALALVGGHLRSLDPNLPRVGLVPDVLMPAMDFLLVTTEAAGSPYEFWLIRAAQVNNATSVAQIMVWINDLKSGP